VTGRQSVTVATFNIRHGATTAGPVRARALATACAALDVDILGLQEVDRRRRRSWMRDQAGVVARRLGARRLYGPALHRGVGEYGNALIARGTISDAEVRRLPGGDDRQTRVAILGRVTVGELEVSVAVTHLQHWPPRLRHLPDEAPAQLDAVLEWLSARPGPRLLLGDLNLVPDRAEPMMRAAGFDVAPTGPTFPAERPRVRVDYVAVDGLAITNAVVAPATGVSDHRPVVAELRATRDSLP
jgi:endonuclease/exonuclease/phosphatase family metal-dependent hydrolase